MGNVLPQVAPLGGPTRVAVVFCACTLDMAVLPFLWVSNAGLTSWRLGRLSVPSDALRSTRRALLVIRRRNRQYLRSALLTCGDPGPTRSRVAQYACRRVADVSTVEATITQTGGCHDRLTRGPSNQNC